MLSEAAVMSLAGDRKTLLYPGFYPDSCGNELINQHSTDFQTREPTDVPQNAVTGSGVCK